MDESNKRRVYLPKGVWTDYWTGKTIPGARWISVEAPLDTLPLYVRENGIIPMGPVLNYVDEKPENPMTVDLYPVVLGENHFILKRDKITGDIKLSVREKRVEIGLQAIGADCELRLRNVKDLAINGKAVEGVRDGNVLGLKLEKADGVVVSAIFVPPQLENF
jgi:alpha-glucosidase (family GH31 glycosyl hydrolase)